jgi:Golgi nucleoside diphosphatase
LLNKKKPCPEDPCLFDGVHAPIFDFSKHRFVGVSEYWYTINEFLSEQSDLSYDKIWTKSSELCGNTWDDLSKMHKDGKFPNSENLDDLKLRCFKSAWIVNVLYNGL